MNIYKKIINTKPRYPDGFDSHLKSLIKHLLRRDLSKRFGNLQAGAEDIKNHRFFHDISFNDLLERKLKPPHMPDTKDFKLTEQKWDKVKSAGVEAVAKKDDPFFDW